MSVTPPVSSPPPTKPATDPVPSTTQPTVPVVTPPTPGSTDPVVIPNPSAPDLPVVPAKPVPFVPEKFAKVDPGTLKPADPQVLVEAVQYTGEADNVLEFAHWVGVENLTAVGDQLAIHVGDTPVSVMPDHWVVKDGGSYLVANELAFASGYVAEHLAVPDPAVTAEAADAAEDKKDTTSSSFTPPLPPLAGTSGKPSTTGQPGA